MYNYQTSIENGYFIFTLMPSLRCSLNCPHCYLSLEQRRNSEIMTIENLKIACEKVDEYYTKNKILKKTIICYWYGGEPTEMGQEYFINAAETINGIFSESKGYYVKHTVLTSLLLVDKSWYPIFDKYGKGEVQSSFDGLMRGKNYLKRWENKVKEVVEYGLKLSTISVVNNELIKNEPEKTLDYLSDLGVVETSWLPFMWNDQNNGEKYNKFAPYMKDYDEFMIRLSKHYFERKRKGLSTPEIGQLRFVISQSEKSNYANIAGQTLFLLPNGDFVLPDYKEGYKEFMQPFGNILTQSFEEVIKSPERRKYIRKQIMRNNNTDCNECEHADKCIMEFWKENRKNDDCFGAKKYVTWLIQEVKDKNYKFQNTTLY